ncbi:MAG: M14 family zinc carboxypeptidase [Planctomycetota bacterium]
MRDGWIRSAASLVFGAWLATGSSCGGLLELRELPADSPRSDATSKGESAANSARPTPAWNTLGASVEGRALRHASFGSGARTVLWVGGIHGDEVEGMVATAELPAEFFARGDLASRVTLHIVEDINPDGRANAKRRNARGVDLNRNYPSRNFQPGDGRGDVPLSEPESRALHDLILRLKPDLVIVAHSWGRRPNGPRAFINYDGPARELAQTFSATSGYPVVESDSIHGTPGSLGSFVGIDLQIPILTLEYERGKDPARCWEETREAILAVIEG